MTHYEKLIFVGSLCVRNTFFSVRNSMASVDGAEFTTQPMHFFGQTKGVLKFTVTKGVLEFTVSSLQTHFTLPTTLLAMLEGPK